MQPVRPFRRALTGFALVLGTLGVTPIGAEKLEIEELATSPVELTAPFAEAALVAGSTAEVAWRPLAGFDELAGAEEWEAFLSVDGGRTYPVRLTPHLDLARRRFVFRVPDLPSDSVRLLLRFGDEHEERAIRLPVPLRIVRAAAPPSVAAALDNAPALAPGESALPGGAGVLFWIEGGRDGSDLRARDAVPSGAHGAQNPVLFAAEEASLGSDESDGSRLVARMGLTTHPAARDRRNAVVAHSGPLVSTDILLLIQRRNE
ncbi:MAG: hypothetical protein ABIV06_05415 [Thermoanaerobaculia bacterium]